MKGILDIVPPNCSSTGTTLNCAPTDVSTNCRCYANNLSPTWSGPAGKLDISDLFADADGNCSGCHSVSQSAAAQRFTHCSVCHTATPGLAAPPETLAFTTASSLKRNAYYSPGRTRAEASLDRTRDGTMPPGAAFSDTLVAPTGTAVGWCDEIQFRVQEWINDGYQ